MVEVVFIFTIITEALQRLLLINNQLKTIDYRLFYGKVVNVNKFMKGLLFDDGSKKTL